MAGPDHPAKWLLRSAVAVPALVLVAYAADRSELMPTCMQQPTGAREVVIRRVVDGDTLVDQCGRKIRVVGIDAPERGDRGGKEATDFVRQWLEPVTQPVTMALCPQQARDRYGRLLARIRRNDQDLSRDMLASGNAWIMAIPPCGAAELAGDHTTLHAAADAGLGVWRYRDLMPRAADAVTSGDGYILLQDQVQGISTNKRHTDLILGHQPDHIVIRINQASIQRLAQAGLAPESLTGTTLAIEGKLYRKDGKTPRIYWDYPELVHRP